MVFLFIFLIVIVLLLFSKIRIQINNCKFDSNKENGRYLNKNYSFIVKLCILSKIPIIKVKITKERMKKWRLKEKINKNIKQLETKILKDNNKFDKTIWEAVKHLNMNFKKIDLYIELGTEDAFLTSILVSAISTIITIILSRKIFNYKDQEFVLKPIFGNQNRINITFSGIFDIKMIHIINMIYILKKKGRVKEYERTSNRGSYDYSYE